jgi:F-box and leucine-rich repeat protein 2/20
VSALGRGCDQLQSINLKGCFCVTDAGVSALGRGCGQLQRIDLSGRLEVTDAGVSEATWRG